MEKDLKFSVADFVVFAGMLLLSLLIGIFYAFKDRKEKSVENYYFGGRNMSPIPVGLSVAVTFISSITVLGMPAHTYTYGTVAMWFGFSLIPQVFISNAYYIPTFRRLKLSSVYEYLELRFNRKIRLLISVMIITMMILYMATTIYLTSLALTAVTPLSMAVSVVVTAGICTVYTSLGGMKAVVWNDAFQSAIMFSGILSVTVASSVAVGGFGEVWEAVERGGRDTFWTWDPDPTIKHSIWSSLVGSGISWGASMCTNQAIIQRYQACKSTRDARIASIIAVIPMITFLTMSCLSGSAMFAFFEGCDPVQSGRLNKIDQTVPYLAVNLFQSAPGMAGLFVSAAYSGMLSTVSSGINSLSALVLEDFVAPSYPKLSDKKRLLLSKVFSVIFGVSTMIMAFVTEHMGETVIQIVLTFFGTFNGPILGLFIVGFHFPWTNPIGAGCGLVSGVVFSMWAALGAIVYGPKHSGILPVSTDNCSIYNNLTQGGTQMVTQLMTQIASQPTITEDERPYIADTLYSISYLYLAPLGMAMCIVVAAIVTLLTGKQNPSDMNPTLFVSLVDNKRLPEKIRNFFRFGVKTVEKKSDKKELDDVFLNKTEDDHDLLDKRSDAIVNA